MSDEDIQKERVKKAIKLYWKNSMMGGYDGLSIDMPDGDFNRSFKETVSIGGNFDIDECARFIRDVLNEDM